MQSTRDAASQTEAAWLAQVAQGDRAAFEQFFHAYEHRLYRSILGFVRVPETAEERTGDVMLEVWKNASKFRGQSKPSTWGFGIAHNKAIDKLRRQAPPTVELDTLAGVADSRGGPEASALAASFRRSVAQGLELLSPEHRAVLELTFNNGCSQAEIAEIVGCP